MKKNILFLFPDQHRSDFMPYGIDSEKTKKMVPVNLNVPNLEKLMDNGVTFSDCLTPSPICAPARACIAYGCNYGSCDVPHNMVNMNMERKTIYSILRDNGYEVMGTGKFDVHKATKFWGTEGWVDDLKKLGFTKAIDNEGKIDSIIGEIVSSTDDPAGKITSLINLESESNRGPYIKLLSDNNLAEDYVKDMDERRLDSRNINISTIPDEYYCDNWITDNTLKLLKESDKEKPWFMQVNFTGPHDPWDITQKMYDTVSDRETPTIIEGNCDTIEIDIEIRKHYIAMIENIDRNIGRIIEYLKSTGELENTLIIYSSDHGEMLGDFNKFGKANFRFPSVNVPLIISGELVKSRGINDSLIQLQDLSATILDYAGICESLDDSFSLVDVLQCKKVHHRDFQRSALANWELVKDNRYKLVRTDDILSLYDTENDLYETQNIFDENLEVVQRLKKEMRKL